MSAKQPYRISKAMRAILVAWPAGRTIAADKIADEFKSIISQYQGRRGWFDTHQLERGAEMLNGYVIMWI